LTEAGSSGNVSDFFEEFLDDFLEDFLDNFFEDFLDFLLFLDDFPPLLEYLRLCFFEEDDFFDDFAETFLTEVTADTEPDATADDVGANSEGEGQKLVECEPREGSEKTEEGFPSSTSFTGASPK